MRMDPIKMEKMSQKALERKCNKPIMEKKRRARINHCLNQLKSLILEADNERSRHSKLEKADILEMTVKYLQTLRAYHVHLNQINQLQQQQQQSQQHAQLQHHFQQQLTSNLKLVSPASTLAMANCHQQRLVAAATAVNNGSANTNNGQSAPQSPIDLQMPVSLAQLPLPLQLSLQAAAASHQLPQSSPEASPKSTTSSSASSTASAASSPRLHSDGGSSTGLSSPTASQQQHQHQQQQILQQAHQNSQHHRLHQQHLQLSQQHLSHLHHHHRHHHHLEQQISPTWRPW